MSSLSLKIVVDEGAVTRTIKFEPRTTVAHAFAIIKDKVLTIGDEHEYGLFLPSTDDLRSGTWLEGQQPLEYYMLRDGDALLLLHRMRNLRVRMLDGTVKTLQVDESKTVGDLMLVICGKIGITNHDEYGLCPMEAEQEEGKESKPASGTLTLRRRPPRERDAKMEQLSKKLKTDDNVEWLDQHMTLREIGIDYNETLLLKRRLFYSDRNVDSRDPKQLSMLYNENKAAILNGKHPVTEDQAINFAAIQCQVNFGDFHEEKHKPGIIEDLKEYLPEQYAGSWGAERRALKLYRKLQGLSQLQAMHLYNKTARELPTYGVTFFLVKEKQKGKNKLISCLLGINANSILRLDVETKEILQEWPLTHVKTYHASKNDTFMLNFGDYSDKPYTVKTNDALRIRDILEGYIDVIRKKLLGAKNVHHAESGAIAQDCISPSKGNMVTHVSSGPSKIVEHSFVGPSRILPFEQGSESSQGTSMMTVQQAIITNKGSSQQRTIVGEIPMRGDMSKELVKKLNRLNSNAVSIVNLLEEPTEANVKKVRFLMDTIQEEMPTIREGVEEASEKQESEEAKRRLKAELEELMNLCAGMARDCKRDDMDPAKMDANAKRMADLTTQIVFSVDPGMRRRSNLLRRSRKSFIQDERVESTLRRASFLTAADAASHAADTASETMDAEYEGPALGGQDLEQLEAAAVDNMGKLNAAVALFLNAHADLKNVDYAAAVNSMNTIKELLPKLAEDAKALSQAQDGKGRQELIDEIKALCDAAKKVCSLTGCDDHAKLQQAANEYGDVSGRLLYVIGGRNPRVNADKENEIVELAQLAGEAAAQLLVCANGLTELAAREAAAPALDRAGVHCANAMKDLITCAQLTAPTIHEAHCRSALSAAIEQVSSQAQALVGAWQPLLQTEERKHIGDDLMLRTMKLAEALDRLRASYDNLDVRDMDVENEAEPTSAERARLRFVSGVQAAKDNILATHKLLGEPVQPTILSEQKINELQDKVSQKMGQINAAVASLLQAKSDPINPDYATAELAANTIAELMPEVIKDAKTLVSSCQDERARQAMLNDMAAWANGVTAVCDTASGDDPKALDDATMEFASASKKLSFVFSPRARKAREQLMKELFASAHKRAMEVVDDTNKMADTIGGASGSRLRDLGTAVHDSADSLRTTVMVTAPTIEEPRCRSELASRSESLSAAASRLVQAANALQDDETGCRVLSAKLHEQRAMLATHADELTRALEVIRSTLDDTTPVTLEELEESPVQAGQRLKFITGASAARQKAKQDTDRLLEQPSPKTKLSEQETKALESKLSRELAAANSAVAVLIQAKTDRRHPDYEAAEMALKLVSDVLPEIIKDSNQLSSVCSEDAATVAARAGELRAWCGAVQAVCARAAADDLKDFVDSAQQFADTSNRLNFVFNPRKIPAKEKQVLQLSTAARDKAKEMADDSQTVADSVGGVDGARLTVRGRRVRDAAQALFTTAQLAAPTLKEPSSRQALLSTADALDLSAQELVSEAAGKPDRRCQDLACQLGKKKQELRSTLDSLRSSCDPDAEDPEKPAKRLKFVSSLSSAQDALKTAKALLNQPAQSSKLTSNQEAEIQKRLSQHVAEVKAGVAALITAKSDPYNPDYAAAESSVRSIADALPLVIKDWRVLSCIKDEDSKKAMQQEMSEWCDALSAVYAGAQEDEPKELDKAAQKFINASNKLQFTMGARRNPTKEQEIISGCGAACGLALQMAARGGGDPRRAAALAAAARALHSAALLTAPSIQSARSVSALAGSAGAVSAAAQQLVRAARGARGAAERGLSVLGEQLAADQRELEAVLADLKDHCSTRKISTATLKTQQLNFITNAAAAQKKAKEVKGLLDQPVVDSQMSEQDKSNAQEKLARAMAQINAALADLLNARADPEHPDYVTADKSLEKIADLMPEVVKETRELSSACEASSRQAMIEDIRGWCDAIHAVCASAHSDDNKELNDSAMKLSDASQKLRFVFSARKNPVKEQQIMQLSSSACDKARQMADETERVAKNISGAEAVLMKRGAAALSDAATALHTTAQLTAPCIQSAQCQAALLSSAGALSARAQQLQSETARAPQPAARRAGEECERYRNVMEKALDGLRTVVIAEDKRGKLCVPPPVPMKRSSLTGAGDGRAPPGRVRVVSHSNGRRASQDWLDHMRRDADQDLEGRNSAGLTRKDIKNLSKIAEIEKKKKEEYDHALDSAADTLQSAEQSLIKLRQAKSNIPEMDKDQKKAIEKQLEHKLALAGIAASKLVSSNHPDEVDYIKAKQSAESLAELVPDIVKDAELLCNTSDDKYRSQLLDHIKGLCEATRRLVRAAREDNKKLNTAAVEFGEKSAGLLYTVSAEADPKQEKGVIGRAKEIGESAIRLADRGASLADSRAAGRRAQALCDAGRHAASAAGGFVYTAKLVAPLIHHQQCQNSLITASHDLSAKLKHFTAEFKPFSSDPDLAKCVSEMSAEANNLEKLLEGFRHDLAGRKLVKRREELKVVDTPLRQLAVEIMELAQQRSKCSNMPDSQKKDFADYAEKLRKAIAAFDLANARFYSAPNVDLKKHRALDDAVQNLQITLLQSRPTLGNKPQDNIVYLPDFVKDANAEAKKFLDAVNSTNVNQDKKLLDAIKDECRQINVEASKVLEPADDQFDEDFEDLHDKFGQDCDERVANIKANIGSMKETQPKESLRESSLPLIESCDMMKFAMKSALSTTQNVALSETLDELNDLSKQIDDLLQPAGDLTSGKQLDSHPDSLLSAKWKVSEAAAALPRGGAPRLPAALLSYLAALRQTHTPDDKQRDRVREHAIKVVDLCKSLTAAAAARVATWQPLACDQLADVTQQILKELNNPPLKETSVKPSAVFSEEEFKKLLIPTEVKVEPNSKVAEAALQQAASKLVSMAGTVGAGAHSADALRRAAPLALAAAAGLGLAARTQPGQNYSQRKRTEEACQEMCWATYGVLVAAEAVSLEPGARQRRRLHSASRALHDAVNKLVRGASTSSAGLSSNCSEAARELQARAETQPAPVSALPYSHCVDTLAAQADILQKLNNDEAMSRPELGSTLQYATAAVCNSTECAAQCAYLLSISEQHAAVAKEGLVDVPRLQKMAASVQDCALKTLRTTQADLAKEEAEKAVGLSAKLTAAAQEASALCADPNTKQQLSSRAAHVELAANELKAVTEKDADVDKIKKHAVTLVDRVGALNSVIERPELVPPAGDMSAETKALVDEVMENSKKLVAKTQALIKDVKTAPEQEPMTWVTFSTSRKALLDAFDGLLQTLRRNGQRVGLLEAPKEEESDVAEKSYLEVQEQIARSWLSSGRKSQDGQKAARVIIDVATQIAEDTSGGEKEELQMSIRESEQLLEKCSKKIDGKSASMLIEELRTLRKAAQRGIVARVVEDFLLADTPLQDLEILCDAEPDPAKRKFLLEKKIAELMSQLGRSSRTARLVGSSTAPRAPLLNQCRSQTELLAPKLVKAAEERVARPHDPAAVERYRALLAEYAQGMARVRDLCDRSLDPMDFVQTAGETMARMREESSRDNSPQRCAYTSAAITRLADRVIVVSMSSLVARQDPELRAALAEAQRKLSDAAPPPGARASTLPDWKDTTAEILRTTGEVESALGGENIFKKQREPDQPIYNAALNLHEAVREWSARDNEIVGVAKRMAVLMARLADQMHTDRKRELIATSKSIVTESIEVAALAKKLALECTDVRIRTNLLQVCERIPTISAQLKMLTQVKATSLANHGGEDDREGMTMIVGNAQNLMSSVQEVVKAAASASVKIASQRGLKWVRKNY